MRILFSNYEYPPLGGGGGVVMAALARQLAKRHEVTVLTSRAGDLPAENIEDNVRVVRVPVFFRRQLGVANFPSMLAYLPTGFARGLRLSRASEFDVINTHFAVPSGPLGHALARWRHIPNVLSVHGGDLFDPSKRSSPHRHAILRAPIRSLLYAADAVIAQSRDTVRNVAEIYGVDRYVDLIPLGIDRPPAAAPLSRRSLGIPDDALVMITIGRLVARKTTAQLVDVVAASPRNVHLLVVGDGPDAPLVRKRAADLSVSDRIHLLGQVSDDYKYSALSASDLFVSASQHEGFGLVFLEAMAFGLPVVCYDHGGQTDFLVSGQTGYVVPLNEIEELARAVAKLGDRAARARIGRHNKALVESYFIDTCAQRYEQLFEQVTDKSYLTASQRHAVPSP